MLFNELCQFVFLDVFIFLAAVLAFTLAILFNESYHLLIYAQPCMLLIVVAGAEMYW